MSKTAPSASFEEIYSVDDTAIIGKGTYSVVKKVVHRETGHFFAAKFVPIQHHHQVPDEIQIVQSLAHPNILPVLSTFVTTSHCIAVMPHVCEGDLFQRVCKTGSRLIESETAHLLVQVLEAIRYLHSNGIVHRDIKLENVLVESDKPFLIDFGLSKRLNEEKSLRTCCGSPNYMSPEILRASRVEVPSIPTKLGFYGTEVDMWAFGVMLYVALTGQYPFFDEKRSKWHRSIIEGKYAFPTGCSISPEAQDLLGHLLDPSAATRFTAEEALQHAWFRIHTAKGQATSASSAENLSASHVAAL